MRVQQRFGEVIVGCVKRTRADAPDLPNAFVILGASARVRVTHPTPTLQVKAMDEDDLPHSITISVSYAEEYMLGLEATVAVGRWGGRARAYTTPTDLQEFAAALRSFAEHPSGEVAFEAGRENGIGLVALRFYQIDRAGHLACHARLASQTATEHRPEEVFRFAIEACVEPSAVIVFARALGDMATSRSGDASLETDIIAWVNVAPGTRNSSSFSVRPREYA
jgi:hypothetical protein